MATTAITHSTASDVCMGLSARVHNAIGPCVGIGVGFDEYYVVSAHVGTYGTHLRAGFGHMYYNPQEDFWKWFVIENSLSASLIYKYQDEWEGDTDTLYFGALLKVPLLPGLGAIFPINVDVGAYTEPKFDQFLLTASIGYGF